MRDPADDLPRGPLVVAASAGALGAASFGGWFVDDAGIVFAYAARVAEGAGFVPYRGGPVVEGFSDPLWVAVLAAGSFVGVPPAILAKILGLLFAASIPVFGARLAARLGAERDGALLVAWFLATSGPLVLWSVSGLETGALALAALVAATVRSPALVGAALAAVVALRPEGPVLAAAVWAGRGAEPGRRATAAVVAATTLAVVCWRRATFDAWWPNTADVKLAGLGAARVVGGLGYAARAAVVLGGPALVFGAVGGRRSPVRALLPAAVGVVVAIGVGGDWMRFGRLIAPVVPLFAAAWLPGVLAWRGGRRWAVVVVLAQVPPFVAAWRGPPLPMALVEELGDLVVRVAPAACLDSTVIFAGPDVGGILHRHPDVVVYDLVGLTDPDAGRDWPRRLGAARPQVVVTHGPWASKTGLEPDVMAGLGYRPSCARRGTDGPSEDVAPTTFWLRDDCLAPLPADVARDLTAWCARPR